jgi:hypothetical protein
MREKLVGLVRSSVYARVRGRVVASVWIRVWARVREAL